jgi:predicted ATP-grasp superfamily ATP-dependent carboligase
MPGVVILPSAFLKRKLGELTLFASRKVTECISHRRKMRILFSRKDDWEPVIRRDFRHSKHELSFGSFSADHIEKYDLVVPLNIPDLKYLNSVRHLITNNPLPIPTIESLCLCDDKYLFNQTLMKNNFGKFVPKISNDLRPPYILKKRIDSWGENSHIILSREQELDYRDKVSSHEYFCQELVPGKHEYATHVLFSKGNIVHSVNIEYIFESDFFIKGKNRQISTKETSRCPYLSVFSSILKLIGFEGLCCVNYKVIDDQPLILEINPRFGGSLCNHFYSFMKYLG